MAMNATNTKVLNQRTAFSMETSMPDNGTIFKQNNPSYLV